MNMNMAKRVAFRQWFFWTCLFVVGATGLSGCASRLGDAGGSSTREIVTSSDEPLARTRARNHLNLALLHFNQDQTIFALDEIKQTLAIDSTYVDAYNLRGLIYMRLNDFQIAEESFRKALDISPRNPNVMHNLGWLLCQQAKYPSALQLFSQTLSDPQYGERAKTFRAQGLCQIGAGQRGDAEISLLKSYELDAGNPITAYNLASVLFQRGDFVRAQFYVRRLNNSELANAESLWLGVKVERRVKNRDAMLQLAAQLLKRFPQSHEAGAYQRGEFDE